MSAADVGEPDQTTAFDRDVEVILITASRRARTGYSIPEPTQVVDADALAMRSPEILTEALRGEPSVHIRSTTPGQASPGRPQVPVTSYLWIGLRT